MNATMQTSLNLQTVRRPVAVPIELHDRDRSIEVRAIVPGATPDSLSVEVTRDRVILSGTATYANFQTPQRRGSRLDSQLQPRSVRRHIDLPAEIDPQSVRSQLRDGVLTLVMAKPQAVAPVKLSLKHASQSQASSAPANAPAPAPANADRDGELTRDLWADEPLDVL